VSGRETDFFVDFGEGDAHGVDLGLLKVKIDIVLIDELFNDSLRRTEIAVARSAQQENKH
jgi:hypothetical protein